MYNTYKANQAISGIKYYQNHPNIPCTRICCRQLIIPSSYHFYFSLSTFSHSTTTQLATFPPHLLLKEFPPVHYLAKFKACICTHGDMQAVTNGETRANTLTACIFWVIMAIVAAFDLEMDQLDAVNAFLNSLLEDEEWVCMLLGMAIQGKVWCLFKVLYGFCTLPCLW